MSKLTVPDELHRKLEAAATARGTTVDALATELLEIQVADNAATPRRRPRLIGVGASDRGISHRVDELLAEGFGES